MANRSDNFNRADNPTALGTPSDGGSAWVAQAGTWTISTNQAVNTSLGPHDIATLDASAADVDVQVTLTAVGGGDYGVVARLSDVSNYLLLDVAAAASITMYKVVAGAFTQLGSTWNGTVSAGDTVKLHASGTSISAYHNGVQVAGPVTDSFNSTATLHGLYESLSGTVKYDDFSVTDLGGGGAPTPHLLSSLGVGG